MSFDFGELVSAARFAALMSAVVNDLLEFEALVSAAFIL